MEQAVSCVKYSATGEIVGKYDEKNLDQVIDAIRGDGTVAELECYRHPLLEVFPNARVTPAVGFENWFRGLKYQCIESFKPLNDDQKIEMALNGIKRTDPVLYHSFVVFKVIQEKLDESTKDLWCSIEKNTTCLLIQCSDNKDDVKFKKIGEKRLEEVKPLSYIYEHVGQKSVQDLINFLRDKKELDKQYHLRTANCQIFADAIISNFIIDSPSSRDWYNFQKIIHLWSSFDWTITPISCPFEFSIGWIPFQTEIGHMPSKMSRNYRLTFRKTLLKVIEKLKDVVNTGSALCLRHDFGMVNEVDNETLRMILKSLEEFSSVLEEETVNGFVFLSWMGRSKTRLGHEEQVLENVTQWHTESMAEEYEKYKERISLLDEVVAPIERQTMKTLSLSKTVKKIEKNARPATEEEMNAYFNNINATRKLFEEFMRDTSKDDFSAVDTDPIERNLKTLENNSLPQNKTKERKSVTIEDIERLPTIDILRRLGQESKDSGKISSSYDRKTDEDRSLLYS